MMDFSPPLKIEKDEKYFKMPPAERMPPDRFRAGDQNNGLLFRLVIYWRVRKEGSRCFR
jgi:hypothetical protein